MAEESNEKMQGLVELSYSKIKLLVGVLFGAGVLALSVSIYTFYLPKLNSFHEAMWAVNTFFSFIYIYGPFICLKNMIASHMLFKGEYMNKQKGLCKKMIQKLMIPEEARHLIKDLQGKDKAKAVQPNR
jgi:hypothetical protein